MEVEDWKDGEGEDDVEVEEEAVGPGADDGEGGGVDQKGGGDGCKAEDYVDVLDSFDEKRVLDIEVEIESRMDGHETCDDSAEEAVVGV